MAQEINNAPSPAPAGNGGSGMGVGMVVGILVVVVVLFLIFFLPRNQDGVDAPTGGGDEVNIGVPDQIDVDVQGDLNPAQ